MGVVEEAIEDGVADDVVPEIRRHLTGEQGTASGVAVVEDLEQIVARDVVEGHEAPVVEDEELGPGETLKEARPRTVTAREPDFVEEPAEVEVACRESVSACLVGERASEERLS